MIWGNRTILSHVGPGQYFAETYALLTNEKMLVDAVANEKSCILFIEISNIKKHLSGTNTWAIKMLGNILTISARKNLMLSGRSFHISPKTIRGRVMANLNTVSMRSGRLEFEIPFDRQQMADYLNVDRSALSKELGKMQDDGLIQVNKNHFVICGS